jgi:acetyl-CoA C-acetyltransferase
MSAAPDWTRVPVVVGAGQVINRDVDPTRAPDPFELMTDAATTALRSGGLIPVGKHGPGGAVTHCWMVHSLSLRHGDPAAELARRLGANDAETRCSGMGGSIPQWLVNRAAGLVVEGRRPVVLIAGAEALATKRRARAAGVELDWPRAPGFPETWPPIEPDIGVHPVERDNGLSQATTMYALVETALAHGYGAGPDRHADQVGELMAGLNAVAAENPYSWFPTRRDANELTTVTEQNRMVSFPYPKYLNAVMDVDMGAAVVVTDAATARAAGLAPDAVAYLRGWSDAHDVWYLSQRPDLARAPALAACAAGALAQAGVTVDDIDAFDLYSCFPSSVEVARDALGVGAADPRSLTLTGGLPYHGGPGSNYVTHAVANALDRVRHAGGHVLVHGNGYYLTKHAIGVYSAQPPAAVPSPDPTLQDRLDGSSPTVEIDPAPTGRGTVAAYTVGYDRDGGRGAAVAMVDLAPGVTGPRRTVAVGDPDLTDALVGGDGVGTVVDVSPGESGNRMRPA